jgi:membrane fusion protein (multidrug efflux system)
VYVVREKQGADGKSAPAVDQQFVKLGAKRGDQVAVISGVKEGEEIVSAGVFRLRPGAPVKVNNSVQPGNELNPKPVDS